LEVVRVDREIADEKRLVFSAGKQEEASSERIR
jgi:hypothetical protein